MMKIIPITFLNFCIIPLYKKELNANQPKDVMTKTIAPAASTPREILRTERQKGMPKIKAATTPLQAPVKGRGMATKIKSASGAQLQWRK